VLGKNRACSRTNGVEGPERAHQPDSFGAVLISRLWLSACFIILHCGFFCGELWYCGIYVCMYIYIYMCVCVCVLTANPEVPGSIPGAARFF
jgi:hypothetical protein